jgi:hypothetical protein
MVDGLRLTRLPFPGERTCSPRANGTIHNFFLVRIILYSPHDPSRVAPNLQEGQTLQLEARLIPYGARRYKLNSYHFNHMTLGGRDRAGNFSVDSCCEDAARMLGACPRIRICRVPSDAWADARRRDASDAGSSSRSANAPDAHASPESEERMGVAGSGSAGGPADLCVARRQRCLCIACSARLELASQAPGARHILILGQASSFP